jgi:hypothetical protein
MFLYFFQTGDTPLHRACSCFMGFDENQVNIIILLIERDADLDLANLDEKLPFDLFRVDLDVRGECKARIDEVIRDRATLRACVPTLK